MLESVNDRQSAVMCTDCGFYGLFDSWYDAEVAEDFHNEHCPHIEWVEIPTEYTVLRDKIVETARAYIVKLRNGLGSVEFQELHTAVGNIEDYERQHKE